jgi:hypothetical protein
MFFDEGIDVGHGLIGAARFCELVDADQTASVQIPFDDLP